MRVLVCGGRDYGSVTTGRTNKEAQAEIEAFQVAMDKLNYEYRFTSLIHGGAKGADTLARIWAYRRGVNSQTYVADWDTEGKAAGILRNQRMLDEGRPGLVVAFRGGRGTADMVRRAETSGIKTIKVD